jgi:hypothetical protein
MPKIDYSKMIIYKLSCVDVNVKYVYVGYTTHFYKKKHDHKYQTNIKRYETLYSIINANGGWTNWRMTLLEKVSCANGAELNEKVEKWKKLYNCTEIYPEFTETPQNTPKKEEIKNPLQCEDCLKTFVKKYGLRRHLLGRCKAEETKESLKKTISEQQEIIQRLTKELCNYKILFNRIMTT